MTRDPRRPTTPAPRARGPARPWAWLLLPLALAACGVDGVPKHPGGRPATGIEQDRNVTISGSAGFGVTHGAPPPSSQDW